MSSTNQLSSWSFPSGRAAVLESWMVPDEFFRHILRGPRDDIYTRVADSLVGECFSHGDDLREAEPVLQNCYRKLIQELQDQSPDPLPANLLLWRDDMRSLKNYIKRHYLDVDVSSVSGQYKQVFWDQLWDGTNTDLPAIFERVGDRVQWHFDDAGEANLQIFDAAFDSAVLCELRRAAETLDSEWIDGYWRRLDCMRGIEFLLRGQALDMKPDVLNLLLQDRLNEDLLKSVQDEPVQQWPRILGEALDGFKLQDISDLEGTERIRAVVHAGEKWLMGYVREGRLVPFGPERVFACLLGLETESYNMCVAVVGRANQMTADLLEGHLRPCYVSGE
ncbi:MAG: V-type ATPase subunit [Planctomycetota bacterium]